MSEVIPRNSPYAPVRVQPLHKSKDERRSTMQEVYVVIGQAVEDSPPWAIVCENRSDADALLAEDPDAVEVQSCAILDRDASALELERLREVG